MADWPDYRIEPQVLAAVAGQLPTPTPRVHVAGEHDGWGYVLMSRLPGLPLDTIWDRVSARDRDRLAAQLGETIATLHQLPPPAITDWQPADWPAFVAQQRARCVSEQLGLGLPPQWADQIPAFLDMVALPSRAPVLLHTEVMRQHLLASQAPGGQWQLSGLIDFEPAMRGEREYEFVSVGVFLAEGDPRVPDPDADQLRLPPRPARPQTAPSPARPWHLAQVQQPQLVDGAAAAACHSHPQRPRRQVVRHRLTARRTDRAQRRRARTPRGHPEPRPRSRAWLCWLYQPRLGSGLCPES